MTAKPVTILLVEDDPVDRETVQRGLALRRVANPLVCVGDGDEALALLRGTDGRIAIEPPILMLVDIQMPGLGGIELIREIRADPALAQTVIFVLTTSNDDRDRFAAYNSNVAGYIVKTNIDSEFLTLASMLEFYFVLVELPSKRPSDE